jgi:large subunit ribosomal protein L25
MQELNVNAEIRQKVGGKGILSAIRRDKKIPGVVYGEKKSALSVVVSEKDIQRVTKAGSNSIINLTTTEGTDKVILKQVQLHAISLDPIHVDFLRISMTHKLEIVVPIHLHGESKVAKESGALVEHMLRELKVRCLPSDIPAEIAIDITELQLNQTINVSNLAMPKGVESISEPSTLVVHLVVPKEEVVEPAPGTAAAATTAEPEVIAKGKKEEEGAEAAAKDGKAAPAKDAKAAPAPKAEKK